MQLALWQRRSIFAVILAAFLSLVMVTPAVAEGEWTPSDKILGSGGANHKYGFDYSSREYVGGSQWSYNTQPVAKEVHPAQTYYERREAARAAAAAEKPLTGKIIEPGKTVVRVPSTYGPVSKFVTAVGAVPGWSRLLGGIGVGMGGTSLAPANHAEIAIAQGVSAGCANGTGACTADETRKKFLIGSCGNLTGAQSCDAIGAKGVTGESDMQKWFKDEALPFLDDLWAKITGQKSGQDVPVDGHYEITKSWGCNRKMEVEYPNASGNPNRLTLHMTATNLVAPRPSAPVQQAGYFDAECSPANLPKFGATRGGFVNVTCMDKNGATGDANGAFGLSRSPSVHFDTNTGAATADMCVTNRGAQPMTIVQVKIGNGTPQSGFATPTSNNYSNVLWSHWINPDPTKDLQEDTKVTTTWQCQTNDGSYTHSFSKSVAKTSAIAAPVCPPGSQLLNHQIKTVNEYGGGTSTIDAGEANVAETAKYPGCFQPGQDGCTLDVWVDGQKCTTSRPECQTWPSINAIQPSRVQCHWGSYTVKTSDCNVISNGYKSETGVVFDPRANTWMPIDAFGNPIAPNPQPWMPTNPSPAPGVEPGTSTPTTPGTGTGFPTEGTNPVAGNTDVWGCMGAMWTWNPMDWVAVPVGCVLQWAFIPTESVVQAKGQEIQDKLTTLGIAGPIVAIQDSFASLPQGGQGCEGPALPFTLPGLTDTLYPFNACTGVLNTAANAVNAFGSLYLVVFGSISFVRAISEAFGFSFNLGKGGSDS